jgi:hypothetical protein
VKVMGQTTAILSRLALLLVAAALFMRAAIPGGWMPAADTDGLVRIVLCTGMGEAEAWLDADGNVQKDKPAGEPKTDSPCTFAALAQAFAPAPVVALPVRFAVLILPTLRTTTVAIGRGLSAPPPPSTGPPAKL